MERVARPFSEPFGVVACVVGVVASLVEVIPQVVQVVSRVVHFAVEPVDSIRGVLGLFAQPVKLILRRLDPVRRVAGCTACPLRTIGGTGKRVVGRSGAALPALEGGSAGLAHAVQNVGQLIYRLEYRG